MKTKFLGCSQVVAAFATVLALSGGTAQAAVPCSVPTLAHLSIQSAVNDPMCNPINVDAGGYVENVTIGRTLTLNGAKAGQPVAGRFLFGAGESTVTGMITIGFPTAAPNVTIDGFSLTNPDQSTGILIKTAGD